MNVENFVKDQKERELEFKVKRDEANAIIESTERDLQDSFDAMFENFKSSVKYWDEDDLAEYLRIVAVDDDISLASRRLIEGVYHMSHNNVAEVKKLVGDILTEFISILE